MQIMACLASASIWPSTTHVLAPKHSLALIIELCGICPGPHDPTAAVQQNRAETAVCLHSLHLYASAYPWCRPRHMQISEE